MVDIEKLLKRVGQVLDKRSNIPIRIPPKRTANDPPERNPWLGTPKAPLDAPAPDTEG
jgi:hypothetical protein